MPSVGINQRLPNAPCRLAVIPGTGIGHEVTREAVRIAEWFAERRHVRLEIEYPAWGPAAYRASGTMIPETTRDVLRKSDAILFGATGGPELDGIPAAVLEAGSLRSLRREFDLFANLRPVLARPSMIHASTLKPEVIDGVDMIVVRELTGGIYFGEPRGIEVLADGRRRGINTQTYTTDEIERVARVAFDLARTRRRQVCSVDKANVMESGRLWRDEVQRLRDAEYPDVALDHLYVDNAAMQLVRNPRQFDVLLTDNLFGDILSDCAAMITGSLGMLPSASFSGPDGNGRRVAFYEPVHGSAPDIAGRDIANPLGAILSFAMALRHSFESAADADLLEQAVADTLAHCRTTDIMQPDLKLVSTAQMGTAILDQLARLNGDA